MYTQDEPTTETSVFVCWPEPQDPGCVDAQVPAAPQPPTSTDVVTPETVVTPTPYVERDVLAYTGMSDGLLFAGGLLIGIGLACLRARKFHTHNNRPQGR